MTPYERVLARCVRVGDCLVWQGCRNWRGYGQITVGGRTRKTHRVVYEHRHGPITDGLTIDHVKDRGCASRACCNVDHLEAVTRGCNVLRGDGPSAQNARKTHCDNGHALTVDNLVPSKLARGHRICRACNRENHRRSHQRRAAAA